MNDFLTLRDKEVTEIDRLLALAKQLEGRRGLDVLAGKTIGLLFMNPSLRTLASFQTAVAHLGGSSFVIQPGAGSWILETKDGVRMDGAAQEHIREAIPVLAQYADILGVRSFAKMQSLYEDLADGLMTQMADLSPVPVINMESASDHPCQALADWKTLDDLGVPREGGKFVLSWAYHPMPLPFAVPRAALTMAALRGMDITVLRPAGYNLPEAMVNEVKGLGEGNFQETEQLEAGMENAHVLYCKSWCAEGNYAAPEREKEMREPYKNWCVDESWFKTAGPNAKFMHCLPVRRNVKVADAVLDGPRSVVIQQAGNRLHAQKAILAAIAEGLR